MRKRLERTRRNEDYFLLQVIHNLTSGSRGMRRCIVSYDDVGVGIVLVVLKQCSVKVKQERDGNPSIVSTIKVLPVSSAIGGHCKEHCQAIYPFSVVSARILSLFLPGSPPIGSLGPVSLIPVYHGMLTAEKLDHFYCVILSEEHILIVVDVGILRSYSVL